MEKLENVVMADVEWSNRNGMTVGSAEVSIDGDTETLVQISGPNAEVVKALFAALEVGLGL